MRRRPASVEEERPFSRENLLARLTRGKADVK